MIALYLFLAVIVVFLLIIVVRTIVFKPFETNVHDGETIEIDKNSAVEALRELVRCKTVSYNDRSQEDDQEFDKLTNLIPKLYPNVADICEVKRFDGRGLLYKWKGRTNEAPLVLMSHYDVVPVNQELWEVEPFEAILKDDKVFGRGTLDTKATLNGILFSANQLIKQGFVPQNDVYLAFSGSEEVSGQGAPKIVDYFEQQGIVPGLVIDEGGAVVEGVFPGVSARCALIGIAEKGMVNLKYTTVSSGGHASAPPPITPIGKLAAACIKVEKNPFKGHVTKPVAEMFNVLGRHSTLLYKTIFANLWCFSGVLDLFCRKSGGELNALVRTTIAFTQMEGSSARNVLPPKAHLVSNIRINPADSVKTVVETITNTINNPDINVEIIEGAEPSRISETNCDAWEKVVNSVAQTWEGSIVAPYLMVQCSDSRHYGRISDKVYRFSAMELTAQERKTIHGNNECIRTESIVKAVEFFTRIIKSC